MDEEVEEKVHGGPGEQNGMGAAPSGEASEPSYAGCIRIAATSEGFSRADGQAALQSAPGAALGCTATATEGADAALATTAEGLGCEDGRAAEHCGAGIAVAAISVTAEGLGDADGHSAGQEQGQMNNSGCQDVNFHVSCPNFKSMPLEEVKGLLADMGHVPLQSAFKLHHWNYVFASVRSEHAAGFRDLVHGSMLGRNVVTVKDGHPRAENSRRPKDGEDDVSTRKKRKLKEFPKGYLPTLKDLKDRLKQRRSGQDEPESVVKKASPLLEWPYETQLDMKATYIKSAVRSLSKLSRKRCEDVGRTPPPWTSTEWSIGCRAPSGCSCPLDPPIGTPTESIVGYRNKCEFTIGATAPGCDQTKTEVGLVLNVLSNSDQIVASAEDVPFVPAPMKRLCGVIRECVRSSPFPIFDRRRGCKNGVWRLVMARLAPSGEMLVMVQTATLEGDDRQKFQRLLIDAIASAPDLRVVSLYLQFNDEVTDAARPDAPIMHINGAARLKIDLLGLVFEIGPLSFFQTNSATCALLYEKAIEWLRPEGAVVLDVCCGVGTIGLCAARRCKEVVGIELVPEAVESASENAELNRVENASFLVGKAEDVLPRVLGDLPDSADICAVVDPPRVGLHHRVTTVLRRCPQLSRIVYVSCNPDSLVEDVARLSAGGEDDDDHFVPVRAVAVDMFPHTLHCEMILLLERSSRVADPRVDVKDATRQEQSGLDVDVDDVAGDKKGDAEDNERKPMEG